MATGSKVTAKSQTYRREFRQVLRTVVETLRKELRVPGVSEFGPNDLANWFSQIKLEDIESVCAESVATTDS